MPGSVPLSEQGFGVDFALACAAVRVTMRVDQGLAASSGLVEFGPDFGPGSARLVSAADLVEMAAQLHLYPAWLPGEPRLIAGDPVIHDCGEPIPAQSGGVLLLAGARPGEPSTFATVIDAGDRGYSAVVVKARGESIAELIKAATRSGIALLVAPDDMSWRALDTLITTTITAQRSSSPAYERVGAGDLFALANAIAYSVGGATAIEDHRGRLFAHSNLPHQKIDHVRLQSITDRHTPNRDVDAEKYLKVRNSVQPVRFQSTEPDYASRLAIAVRAGGQLLGAIWVLDDDPPLRPGAEKALEDAARVTALHLVQIRRREDVRHWNRGELLGSLLNGDITPSAAAALLGIPATMPTVVLALAPSSAAEHYPALGVARSIDLVNLYCEAWHPQALCTTLDGAIYGLVPARAETSGHRSLVKFARDVVDTVQRTAGLTLRAGIGPVAEKLEDVPACRRMADLVLDALPRDGSGPRVASIEELRSRVILRELADRGVLNLAVPGDPVQQIRDHDGKHGTNYEQSLLAYLEAFGEAPRAAKVLCVHENTLRYRLRRMESMFNLQLDDPDTRLLTWLQLRLSVPGGLGEMASSSSVRLLPVSPTPDE